MTPSGYTNLPDETISSITAICDRLDSIQQEILLVTGSDETVASDNGTRRLRRLVYNAQLVVRSLSDPPGIATEQMPQDVISIISKGLIPALTDLVGELKTLWANLQDVVGDNYYPEGGDPIVTDFLRKARDNDSSPLMRMSSAIIELHIALITAITNGIE